MLAEVLAAHLSVQAVMPLMPVMSLVARLRLAVAMVLVQREPFLAALRMIFREYFQQLHSSPSVVYARSHCVMWQVEEGDEWEHPM